MHVVKEQITADNIIRKKFPNLASRTRGMPAPGVHGSQHLRSSANYSMSDSKKYNPQCGSSNSSNSGDSQQIMHSTVFKSEAKFSGNRL